MKYVCFNAKPSDFGNEKEKKVAKMPSNVSLYYAERSSIEEILDLYSSDDYALRNVLYDKDRFTFDTNFSEAKVVLTQLGYDAGWSLSLKDEDAEESLPIYKLNGGFVGFLLPSGKHSYVLRYETPYLKEGIILASGALALFSLIEIGGFVLMIQKRRKETRKENLKA